MGQAIKEKLDVCLELQRGHQWKIKKIKKILEINGSKEFHKMKKNTCTTKYRLQNYMYYVEYRRR